MQDFFERENGRGWSRNKGENKRPIFYYHRHLLILKLGGEAFGQAPILDPEYVASDLRFVTLCLNREIALVYSNGKAPHRRLHVEVSLLGGPASSTRAPIRPATSRSTRQVADRRCSRVRRLLTPASPSSAPARHADPPRERQGRGAPSEWPVPWS